MVHKMKKNWERTATIPSEVWGLEKSHNGEGTFPILYAINKIPNARFMEISKSTGLSLGTQRATLKKLIENGYVKKGSKKFESPRKEEVSVFMLTKLGKTVLKRV